MVFFWFPAFLSVSQPFVFVFKILGGCDVTTTPMAILKHLANTRVNQWGEIFGCFLSEFRMLVGHCTKKKPRQSRPRRFCSVLPKKTTVIARPPREVRLVFVTNADLV
jgi:hypothetical protein